MFVLSKTGPVRTGPRLTPTEDLLCTRVELCLALSPDWSSLRQTRSPSRTRFRAPIPRHVLHRPRTPPQLVRHYPVRRWVCSTASLPARALDKGSDGRKCGTGTTLDTWSWRDPESKGAQFTRIIDVDNWARLACRPSVRPSVRHESRVLTPGCKSPPSFGR